MYMYLLSLELYHSNAIKSPPPPRRPPDHVPGGVGPIQTIGQSTSLGPTTVGSSKKSKGIITIYSLYY